MVKLKVIKKFHDLETGKHRTVGDELEVTVERAKKLLKLGLVQILFIKKIQ